MSDVNFNQKPKGWATKWTEEEDNILRENYSSKTIEEMLVLLPNRNKKAIYSRSHKLGLKYCTYNENYFEVIDSPAKAYWLGFLYTDGYVTTNYRWGVELSIKDISHLELFLKDFDSNIVIRTRTRTNKTFQKENTSCSIQIKNKKMYNSLLKKGVVQNKTKTLKFPTVEQVPKEFMPDFIRGLFDGDGSYSITKNGEKYRKYSISFVSASCDFVEDLKKVLDENNIRLNISKNNRDELFVLRTEKKQTVIDFFDYIYYDESCRCLKRKKDKSLEMLEKLSPTLVTA